MQKPTFPITITWYETGEVEKFESLEEIESNIEEFDSERKSADVKDAYGKLVRLRVSLLNAELFELEE